MSHPPPSHDSNLPSALDSLFSEGGHFLQQAGDSGDILIDPVLADTQQQEHHEHHVATQAQESPALHMGEAESAQATPAPGDLAEHEQDQDETRAALAKVRAARRTDTTALDVTIVSLRSENERLRKMVAALEAGDADAAAREAEAAATAAVAAAAGVSSLDDSVGGDDGSLITQHTLRELASAAVGEAALASFGFESLQQHLEQQAAQEQTPDGSGLDTGHTGLPGVSEDEQEVDTTGITASDFLHGLVSQVTVPPPKGNDTTSTSEATSATTRDPFHFTRVALMNDIAATRAVIATKEAELQNAAPDGTLSTPPEPLQRSQLEVQIASAKTLIDANQQQATVLGDMAARMGKACDRLRDEVKAKEGELAELSGDGDDESQQDVHRSLVEVRSYIEGVLKVFKEKGTLPAAPLPHLPLLMRSDAPLPPPPSTLPKKRGRPARAVQKPSVVPAALAHLVPDPDAVKAREQNLPIRRKGIKRNKTELEREKQREEEEGEMLRNLVGMGVWAREGSLDAV